MERHNLPKPFLQKEDVEKIIGDCKYAEEILQYNDLQSSYYWSQTFQNKDYKMVVDEYLLDDGLAVNLFYKNKFLAALALNKKEVLHYVEQYYKIHKQ